MNKLESIKNLRKKLKSNFSIGSWIQISDATISEIIGDAGYDWAAVDMEHGQISDESLPNIFRALELGNTLPFARLAYADTVYCKKALDAGAAGVIIPNIQSAEQLIEMRDAVRWPPAGKRGVGFSRANLDQILEVEGLDAIFIGPYDLSASLKKTGDFSSDIFLNAIASIKDKCKIKKIPCGIHVVQPSLDELKQKIDEGYSFIAYSMDTLHLRYSLEQPFLK